MTDLYPRSASGGSVLEKIDYTLWHVKHGAVDWDTGSVRQIDCINVLQFADGQRRTEIWNEWQRVLIPGGRVCVVVPYYSHVQAHAHPHTQWPPFSEFSFSFLNRVWRTASPSRFVDGLECDFEVESTAIDMDGAYATRSQEWKDEALRWFNNCAVQMTVWLVKR